MVFHCFPSSVRSLFLPAKPIFTETTFSHCFWRVAGAFAIQCSCTVSPYLQACYMWGFICLFWRFHFSILGISMSHFWVSHLSFLVLSCLNMSFAKRQLSFPNMSFHNILNVTMSFAISQYSIWNPSKYHLLSNTLQGIPNDGIWLPTASKMEPKRNLKSMKKSTRNWFRRHTDFGDC